MSSAYALETEDSVTINKLRSAQPWVRFSTDYVRCFCNLPTCVTTGYMCKSSGGGCFSNFRDHFGHQTKEYKGRHGCVELLSDKEHRSWCESNPEKASSRPSHQSKTDPKSLIFCCYHDMCNHIDSPQTRNLMNNTLLGESLEYGDNNIADHHRIGYTNSQIWFRAATIAVPICGAFILFALIALAIKILRNENRNTSDQKLGSIYEHQMPSPSKLDRTYDNILRTTVHQQQKCPYQYHGDELQRIQMPLLITNEINYNGNKNETNAKLNLMQCDSRQSIIFEIEKEVPKCAQVNLVKHVNVESKFVVEDRGPVGC